MATELNYLEAGARGVMSPEFLRDEASQDFSDYVVPSQLDRRIGVDLLRTILKHAMDDTQFQAAPETSDSWLAPRVHAVIRLRRREASDRRLWAWLAVVAYPEYVRWRFAGRGDGGTALKRFVGGDRDNALSRLWWGAELTRNGGDYSPTVRAFRMQDIPNTWFALNAFHHPAAAQAALAWLPTMSSDDINKLAKAFNHYLTTVMLDAMAEANQPDEGAIEEWLKQEPNEAYLMTRLPDGPEEDAVPKASVVAVQSFVKSIAKDIGLALPDTAA